MYIYRRIDTTEFLRSFNGEKLLDFIQKIVDLSALPSMDARFNKLYGDLKKHIVDNDDYSLDEALLGKVDVLKDVLFEKFLFEVLNQNWYREVPEKYEEVWESLRSEIAPFNLKIQKRMGDDGLWRGEIFEVESRFSLVGIDRNEISILFVFSPKYPAYAVGNQIIPLSRPALVLAFDSKKKSLVNSKSGGKLRPARKII